MSRLTKTYIASLIVFIVFGRFDSDWAETIKTVALLWFCVLSIYYVLKFTHRLFRRFLWRIRRKLILSYIFVGLVPILLLAVLVVLGFWIFIGQATSEMFNSSLDAYLLQTKLEARKLLHNIEYDESQNLQLARDRWMKDLSSEELRWLPKADITLNTAEGDQSITGSSPMKLPQWGQSQDFSRIVLRGSMLWLTAIVHDSSKNAVLQVHVPIDMTLLNLIREKIGADISYFMGGRSAKNELDATVGQTSKQPVWPVWWDLPMPWLSLPDQVDWKTGKTLLDEDNKKEGKGIVIDKHSEGDIGGFFIRTNISRVYKHIFSRSTILQKVAYVVMAGVAIVFLVIELISLISGVLLAKSITASVHNLFEGTERIKKGDLDYKIKVTARDQLGDLAASFNNMTDSIQNLLKERAEHERLAESLRIARQMQQNLLPREITSVGGIEIATMNLPAQEVCGDYYDIISRDHELGIIIADVSGKGPSAALYMAEVKGVMLSVSQRTLVPREVLLEANNILSPTLDSRNFITMSYAVINEPMKTMKMSRAGHNPVLYYSACSGEIEIVQPKGIGLGLARNGIFESALDQVERKLQSGDVLVFYTDGLTEAMNERNELYGLPRLTAILAQNNQKSAEQMKAAILHDLEQFLNKRLPQDDVTLVLLKIQ